MWLLHVADEGEPLVLAADAGHRSIDEHQGEVLRVLAAEFVDAPEDRADAIQRRQRGESVLADEIAGIAQQPESLFGQREEDVVLAREVEVDGGGAVLDPFGDLADRDVLVALGDEQFAGGVENRRGGRPRDRVRVVL